MQKNKNSIYWKLYGVVVYIYHYNECFYLHINFFYGTVYDFIFLPKSFQIWVSRMYNEDRNVINSSKANIQLSFDTGTDDTIYIQYIHTTTQRRVWVSDVWKAIILRWFSQKPTRKWHACETTAEDIVNPC